MSIKNYTGIGKGTWNIGFMNDVYGVEDETQFDLTDNEGASDLEELWVDFADENGFDPNKVLYVKRA